MAIKGNTKRSKKDFEEHVISSGGSIDSLPMKKIQGSIQWRGFVLLHITGERCESFLADFEYPIKSGTFWYADATTGLLFDKQTGACRQATTVALDLASIESSSMTRDGLRKRVAEKEKTAWEMSPINRAKPGPKPKGYVSSFDEDDDDDSLER